MELSNRSLALLLIAAIIISLGSTLISLNKLTQFEITGLAAGQVNISISTTTSCNVDTNVSFGQGSPTGTTNLSTDKANLYSFYDCTSALTGCYNGLQINNTGNTNEYINFTSNSNASILLGDYSPSTYFTFDIINGTYKGLINGGCFTGIGGSMSNGGGGINASVTGNNTLCYNLSYVNEADIISIGFNITVNETTPKTGLRTALITITCGAV